MEAQRMPGERDSLAMARERIRAWWTAVLAGQVDQPHPILGTNISASVRGETLIVRGTVPSRQDREEVRDEVQPLIGHGVSRVKLDLRVRTRETGERGLLRQTLIGTFASAEQAGFAAGYLEGQGQIAREGMLVIQPGDASDREKRRFISELGEPYARQLRERLQHGQSALIVSVDEIDAFRVRELLDEETRSIETLVLPPQPARPRRPAPTPVRAKAEDDAAQRAQNEALAREAGSRGG